MSKMVTRADAHLAGQLGLPVGEFHRLAYRAGADAIRRIHEATGEVKVPVYLAPDPNSTEDRLPVYLPREVVQVMQDVCAAADIGSVGDYVADLYGNLVIESIQEVSEGKSFGFNGMIGDIIDGFKFDDPDEAERKMVEAVSRWQIGDDGIERKEAAVAA